MSFFSHSQTIWPWTFTEYLAFFGKPNKIFWNTLFWLIESGCTAWYAVFEYYEHHIISFESHWLEILTRLLKYFSKSKIYFRYIDLCSTWDRSFLSARSANLSLRPNLQQLPVALCTFLASFPNYSDLNNGKSWKNVPILIIRNIAIKNEPTTKK
jgi:hypothetical protein